MTATSYDEVLTRINGLSLHVIAYNQNAISSITDRRCDCSGLTCFFWGTPKTGPGTYLNAHNTESLWAQGIIVEIPFSELRPGDAIGHCGPGSAGNGGHIAPWLGYGDGTTPTGTGRHHVRDHGSGMGPNDRWVQWDGHSTGWLHPNNLKAWRLHTLAGHTTPQPPQGGTDMSDWATAQQKALRAAGYDIGNFGPAGDGVDGIWGDKSQAALNHCYADAKTSPSLPDHAHKLGPWTSTDGVV